MDKLIFVGGGEHCRSCVDVILEGKKYQIIGILDKINAKQHLVCDIPIIGDDSLVPNYVKDCFFSISLGDPKGASRRNHIFDAICAIGGRFATIVSPRAHVSRFASLGLGTFVLHDCLVNSGAVIGRNCILNTKSLIEHDVVIGDHVHISTAVVVNGGCKIGDNTYIGSGTVLRDHVQIGPNVFIGAGSYVNRDILISGVYIGVPARKIDKS